MTIKIVLIGVGAGAISFLAFLAYARMIQFVERLRDAYRYPGEEDVEP
jgi:hypothetical protein